MALPVTITGISTAVAPVGPFQCANGPRFNITGPDNASFSVGGSAATERRGQTFTTFEAMNVTTFAFRLSKTGTPTDNYYVELYATSGGAPTGSVLGTSNLVAASGVGPSANWIRFVFSTSVPLATTTQYAAVLRRDGALNASNYLAVWTPSINSHSGGGQILYNTGVWDTSATNDFTISISSDTPVYYFFGRDSTTATTLQAYIGTDPTVGWGSVSTKTGFTTAILTLNGYQVGNVIHLLVCDGTAATSVATKYVSFDMPTFTFLATTETVAAAAANTGQIGVNPVGATCVVRSNGEVVAFYNGVQTKTSGTFRARAYYRRRTAVNTWSTETQVDNNTASDAYSPIAVLGAADRVHFVWGSSSTVWNRTLSAANALNTAASSGSLVTPGDAVSYDRSGTTKVVVTSNEIGTSVQKTEYFNSADNPTINFADQGIATASVPHRIGVDISTDDVTIIYRNSTDSDLYAIKSTDDGATFGAPVSFFVGTVGNADANASRSASGSMYARGGNFVVGYIVNDNGTLKYNEYTLRAVITTKTWVKQAGTWKPATTWVKQAGTWKKPTKSYVKKTGVWTEV